MAGEAKLWDRWQDRLKEDFYVQRIENMVGGGVPDVHLTNRQTGSQHWLELKYIPAIPKRESTRVLGNEGLRPDQIAWIYGRSCAGASIFVLVGVDEFTFLVSGMWAREVNSFTFSELESASSVFFKGKLMATNYAAFVQIILGGHRDTKEC